MLQKLEPLILSMRLRTLIVDDEPVARKILREELELVEDVEIVAEADSGAAALEQIARHQPDLVFLDLHMPAMGGLDVVRRLDALTHSCRQTRRDGADCADGSGLGGQCARR